MAHLIKFKRGDAADVDAYVPAAGEPVFDLTRKGLRIGDGIKVGGYIVSRSGFHAGTGTFNGTTGVSVPIGETLAGTTYRVIITPTANPINVGSIYVSAKEADTFTVKCTGSDTSCTFDWILIDMN